MHLHVDISRSVIHTILIPRPTPRHTAPPMEAAPPPPLDEPIQALTTRFDACVEQVRAASSVRLGTEQRLELYSLFKQATEGDNTTPPPSLLDLVGKAKWWVDLVGGGLEAVVCVQLLSIQS